MNIEVFLTGSNLEEEDVKGRMVVVIDVLRACSTIVTALANGARSVVPVADMAQAGKIASNLDQRSYLLGGERDGQKIEGYHFGNSPLEYDEAAVKDRTVILNTTNGTTALSQSRQAEHLVVGCLLNASVVIDFVRSMGLPTTLVCAGWRNRVSLEDTLCAGLFLYELWEGREPDTVSDTAHIAYTQYANDRGDLHQALNRSHHARWLSRQGYADDVAYSFQLDAVPVLPYYDDSRLILKSRIKESA